MRKPGRSLVYWLLLLPLMIVILVAFVAHVDVVVPGLYGSLGPPSVVREPTAPTREGSGRPEADGRASVRSALRLVLDDVRGRAALVLDGLRRVLRRSPDLVDRLLGGGLELVAEVLSNGPGLVDQRLSVLLGGVDEPSRGLGLLVAGRQ